MSPHSKQQKTDNQCHSGREDCSRFGDLEATQERYQSLFEAVTDALISISLDGQITQANTACEKIFERDLAELIGQPLSCFFQVCTELEPAFVKARKGENQSIECSFTGAGGQQKNLSICLTSILDRDEISGVLLLGRDLSLEKVREVERAQLHEKLWINHRELQDKAAALEESQQKLQQAMDKQEKVNAELREVARMKSDFIGIASHELRTPLTFLFGALEYLQESLPGRLTEDEQSLLDYAMQGSQRLSDIVENMLDIVRLDSEGFSPHPDAIFLFPLLTHLKSSFAEVLTDRQLSLDLGNSEDWPALFVDPGMIRRALKDLIGNAAKYTEPGGEIRLHGVMRSRESLNEDAALIRLFWPDFPSRLAWEGDFFEIRVADNGVGIPKHELPHVFERFYTVGKLDEHSSGDKFLGKGAGLGLALVKRIMLGHEGLSWADSPGSIEETGLAHPGSSFHLLLPYRQKAKKSSITISQEHKYKILVIDDEPPILRLVDILLNKDYDLELASSGADGLSKASVFQPDMILLDLFMPDMDGLEVCEKLKADPLTADIPVAILTALTRKFEREKGDELGAIDYITKPFYPSELQQRIEYLLARHCNKSGS